MVVVLLTNVYNIHQKSVSEELYKTKGVDFYFIETEPINQERKEMGWEIPQKPAYVLSAYKSKETLKKSLKLINDADLVIIGKTNNKLLRKRHKNSRIVFHYCERFFKTPKPRWQMPLRMIKNYFRFDRYKNDYVLCASAYTTNDLQKTRSMSNKTYKWGYFTYFEELDVKKIINRKYKEKTVSILWVGRMLKWKHPEACIVLAKNLINEDIDFKIKMIGSGPMLNEIKKEIYESGLEKQIIITERMSNKDVREEMKLSQIFIFTSGFEEGWGAVLNEAMNSACAVVASCAIGSVPFLINNNDNGLIYDSENRDDFIYKVKSLINNKDLAKEMSERAYRTIKNEWNPQIAAKNVILLYQALKDKRDTPIRKGPCSKATVTKICLLF